MIVKNVINELNWRRKMLEKNENKTTFVIKETAKPHSYETGKVGNRFKIYYKDVEELKKHLTDLKEAGLIEEEQN